MKHLRRMSGATIAKLVSSFSLLILVAVSWANTYREFSRDLSSANTVAEIKRVAASYTDLIDAYPELVEAYEDELSDLTIDDFKGMIAMRAAAEVSQPKEAAKSQAKQIKASPLYRDPGVSEQSNWLDGAMRRLADLMPKRSQTPNINLPRSGIPGWIVPGMWVILALAVATFGYFAIRHFSWKRALKRKATAVLEDDEPERTLDEWLTLADEHAAAGRFREAVRAMYLSCLLKFDEAGVARFVRGETNWEHLNRITNSPKKPASIDFRPPTQTFDRIWYGFHVKGSEDVEQFRTWYKQITEDLRGVRK